MVWGTRHREWWQEVQTERRCTLLETQPSAGLNEVQLSPICIKHLSAQGWIHSESQQGAGDRAVGNILQAGKGAAAREPRGPGPVSRGLPTPSLVS